MGGIRYISHILKYHNLHHAKDLLTGQNTQYTSDNIGFQTKDLSPQQWTLTRPNELFFSTAGSSRKKMSNPKWVHSCRFSVYKSCVYVANFKLSPLRLIHLQNCILLNLWSIVAFIGDFNDFGRFPAFEY